MEHLSNEDYERLNDVLADILCLNEGFKIGLLSNPNGNSKQRDALMKFSDKIGNLTPHKVLIHALVKNNYRQEKTDARKKKED
tara:strand:- start:286 stop:534 length:249 start_codon:yes stop_codon:yes gene_type:complete